MLLAGLVLFSWEDGAMIKVIMIVVTAIFLSSWYACLVAGKRADEEISALFEKEKKQGSEE